MTVSTLLWAVCAREWRLPYPQGMVPSSGRARRQKARTPIWREFSRASVTQCPLSSLAAAAFLPSPRSGKGRTLACYATRLGARGHNMDTLWETMKLTSVWATRWSIKLFYTRKGSRDLLCRKPRVAPTYTLVQKIFAFLHNNGDYKGAILDDVWWTEGGRGRLANYAENLMTTETTPRTYTRDDTLAQEHMHPWWHTHARCWNCTETYP